MFWGCVKMIFWHSLFLLLLISVGWCVIINIFHILYILNASNFSRV